MNHKYTGSTPVKTGEKIEVLDNPFSNEPEVWVEATVQDALASQCTTKEGIFLFYTDVNVRWRKIK